MTIAQILFPAIAAGGAWLSWEFLQEKRAGTKQWTQKMMEARQRSAPQHWRAGDWKQYLNFPVQNTEFCDISALGFVHAVCEIDHPAGQFHIRFSSAPLLPNEIITIEKIPLTTYHKKTGMQPGITGSSSHNANGRYTKLLHLSMAPGAVEDFKKSENYQQLKKAEHEQTLIELKAIAIRSPEFSGGEANDLYMQTKVWGANYLCPLIQNLRIT